MGASSVHGQVTLPASGTYTETFDGIASGYPTGWSSYTGATATTLGTTPVLTTAVTAWNNGAGAFKNFASGDIGAAGNQSTATDRALGVRQTGAFGDNGAAFALQLANTTNLTNFALTFKLQSLDAASPRVATWRVDYGFGASPSSFIAATATGTLTTGGTTFSNNTITINFGAALNNNTSPVWIRVVTLAATSSPLGGGNRPSTGIDDFVLTYTTSPVAGPALTASPVTLSGFIAQAGTVSASQSYTLTTRELTATVTITAPTSYEVSLDNSSFATTQTLPQTTTTATVYARLTASAAQGSTGGTITNVSGAQSASVTVSGTVGPPAGTFAKISSIQGSGNTLALSGLQNIEGIVTRTFPGATGLSGFYVQEEAADSDGNSATSEGIFCFDPSNVYTVSIGDKVQVSGTAVEFASASGGVNSSVTQMSTLTSVLKVGTESLPAATIVTLPVAAPTGGVSFLERYEGMLVDVRATTGNLTVTDNFTLGRFGQIGLAAMDASTNQPGTDARIDQYTQFNTPSVSGNATYQTAVLLRQIILDDANGSSNTGTPPLASIIHARGGNPLSASNTLRGGDDVTSITGILDERFEGYRIQSNTPVNFNAANPRPTGTPNVGGTLKAGFANVLNYFTTFGGSANRGASDAAEFTRQRAKVIANLLSMGADIIGLGEVQNNGYGASSAIQDLVNGLNDQASTANSYTFLNAGTTATDAITVAFVYRPASVSLVGSPAILNSTEFASVGRGAIAQTFQQLSGRGVLTVVANHWKSKGGNATGTDIDANDGQGPHNATRAQQARELAAWLATKPTGTQDPDYLIMGDLNAYAQEEPLTIMATAGYPSLLPNSTYSYLFNGDWGSLDHALGNSTLASQMTGAEKVHNNADEPIVLDYNIENKSVGQQASLFAPDQYRSSDHDPVVVGFNLTTPALPVQLIDFRAAVMGDKVSLAWETASESSVSHFLIERSTDAREFGVVGRVLATGNSQTRKAYGLIDDQPLEGTTYYRLRTIDLDGTSTTSKMVAVTIDDVTPEMTLMGNPVVDNQIQLAVRNMAGATYSLRSLTGQTIRTQTLQHTNRAVTLQLGQTVATGVYLLEGVSSKGRKVLKVVID